MGQRPPELLREPGLVPKLTHQTGQCCTDLPQLCGPWTRCWCWTPRCAQGHQQVKPLGTHRGLPQASAHTQGPSCPSYFFSVHLQSPAMGLWVIHQAGRSVSAPARAETESRCWRLHSRCSQTRHPDKAQAGQMLSLNELCQGGKALWQKVRRMSGRVSEPCREGDRAVRS